MNNEVNNVPVEQQPAVQPGMMQPMPNNNMMQPPKGNGLMAKIKSFGVVPVVIVAVVVVALIAGVSYKVVSSSPKAVFKAQIKNAYKKISNGIEDIDKFSKELDLEKNAFVMGASVKVDTNVDVVKEALDELGIKLSDYSFGADLGIDIKNEQLQVGAYVKGKKEKIDLKASYQDSKMYLETNLYDKVLTDDEVGDIDFTEIQDAVAEFKEATKDVEFDAKAYDAIIKSITDALIESIDNDKMEKESAEVKVAGNKVKLTKYSYEVSEKSVKDFVKNFAKNLKKDKDFKKKLAEVTGLDEDEIEEAIESIEESADEIEFEGKAYINIYTHGLLNDFAGISVEYDKKEYITYLTDDDNWEIVIDNHVDDEYGKMKLVASCKTEKKVSKIKVKYNDTEIANVTVREFSDEKIDLDFEITVDEETVKGSIYFTCNLKDSVYSGEYKVKGEYDDYYVSLEGDYHIGSKPSLDKVNTSNVQKIDDLTEDDAQKILDKLEGIAKSDEAFSSIYEELKDQITESQGNNNNNNIQYYNSIGMTPVYSVSEVEDVLSKNTAVLYVGETYYYDSSAADFLDTIQDLQEDLGFHSYYYASYSVNDSFKELIAEDDVEVTCTDGETCLEYPIVYLIKNGKIVRAVQGKPEKSVLKNYLYEIGIY